MQRDYRLALGQGYGLAIDPPGTLGEFFFSGDFRFAPHLPPIADFGGANIKEVPMNMGFLVTRPSDR